MHLKHQWQASKEITGQLGTIENNEILIKENNSEKICCQKSRQKTYFTVCSKLKARAFRLVNNYILNLEKNIFVCFIRLLRVATPLAAVATAITFTIAMSTTNW